MVEHGSEQPPVSFFGVSVAILEADGDWAQAVARTVKGIITPRDPLRFDTLAGALEHLTRQPVDLIFVDLDLRDSRGLATLSRLREAVPLAAVVVMTSEAQEETALESVRQGAQDYLVKGRLDSTVLRSTARFALERMHVVLEVHRWERLLGQTLDALAAGIALVDGTGRILMVNQGWEALGAAGHPFVQGCGVGANYLALCDRLVNPEHGVHAVARGLLQVAAGLQKIFTMEYALPQGPGLEPLWFELRVTRFEQAEGTSLVVSHLDVTERHALRSHRLLMEALHGVAPMEAGSFVLLLDAQGGCHFQHPPGGLTLPCALEEVAPLLRGLLDELFRTGSLEGRRLRLVLDGEGTVFHLHGAVLVGVQGAVPLALLTLRRLRDDS